MAAQPLFQFGTVALNPAPDRRMVGFQTALGEQFFDIAERERMPKIPADCAENEFGRRLPPLEDRRSRYIAHDLFSLPTTIAKLATPPTSIVLPSESSKSPRQSLTCRIRTAQNGQYLLTP